MKQQDTEMQHGSVYRALLDDFTLPEHRVQALEQRIRREAFTEHRTGFGFYARRLAPAMLCAAAVIGGVFWMKQTPPEQYSGSGADSNQIVEIVTDLTELTAGTDAPADTGSAVRHTQTRSAAAETTTVTVTETPDTQSAQTASETAATTAVTTPSSAETAAPVTSATQPASSTAATESEPPASTGTTASMTVSTTVTTTEQTAADPPVQQPRQREEDALLWVEDVTAHAGETVTLKVELPAPLSFAGIQLFLCAETDDAGVPLPQLLGMEVLSDTEPSVGVDGSSLSMVWAHPENTEYPAGTLALLTVRIPDRIPAGTVYRITEDPEYNNKIVILDENPESQHRTNTSAGIITVIE